MYVTETEEWKETTPSRPPGSAGTGECHLIASLVNHVLQVAVSELKVGSAKAGLDTPQQAPGATELLTHTDCVGAEMNAFNNNSVMGEPIEGKGRCLRFHGSRQSLEDFKRFLQGTPGEKVLHLWMDIERLRTLQSSKGKNR